MNKKHARFVLYDKLFRRAGEYYNRKKILFELKREGLEVQESCFHKDIREITKTYKVNFNKKLKKQGFYQYDETSFSIYGNYTSVSEKDTIALRNIIGLLNTIGGSEKMSFLNETIIRFENRIQESKLKAVNAIEFFDINESIIDSKKNSEILRELYDHIINKQNIIIEYKLYNEAGGIDKVITQKVSPHYLKQSVSQRWYLIGASPKSNKKLDIFSLPRILTIRLDKRRDEFIYPKIDYKRHFKDRIGVSNAKTKNKKKEKITLLISKGFFHLFDNKPPHHSYKRENNKSILIGDKKYIQTTLELKPNLEFESIILGYGENVLIKDPIWLKKRIHGRIKSLLKLYK